MKRRVQHAPSIRADVAALEMFNEKKSATLVAAAVVKWLQKVQ